MGCLICGNGPLTCLCNGGIGNGIGPANQAAFGGPFAAHNAGLGTGGLAAYQNSLAQLANQQAFQNLAGLQPGGIVNVSVNNAPAERGPLEKAGTAFGEFIGWRIWGLKGGYLTSYSAQYAWMPGHSVHGEVFDNGYGGIWAFKEPHYALHKALEGNYIVGSVWLWGEVVEHTIGFRAEYAAVRSIEEMTHNEGGGGTAWQRWREKRQARLATRGLLADLRERYASLAMPLDRERKIEYM